MKEREALKLTLLSLKELVEKFDSEQFTSICELDEAKEAIEAAEEALAQPEFIKHEVENVEDWSEWVCPNPSGYLVKCCDCGLVHEAEFGVVRYKSETEREDCDMVDDPNLQAVFRMRRSEKWSPEDTAHRAGGLPMAQPEQEPVAWTDGDDLVLRQDWAERFDWQGSWVGVGRAIPNKWKPTLYTQPQPKAEQEPVA